MMIVICDGHIFKVQGSISHTFFGVNLVTLLCKLDHFIKIRNIYGIFTKRSSLQNGVGKFTSKKFYEIDPQPLGVSGERDN
jgi:hypothetical protein